MAPQQVSCHTVLPLQGVAGEERHGQSPSPSPYLPPLFTWFKGAAPLPVNNYKVGAARGHWRNFNSIFLFPLLLPPKRRKATHRFPYTGEKKSVEERNCKYKAQSRDSGIEIMKKEMNGYSALFIYLRD